MRNFILLFLLIWAFNGCVSKGYQTPKNAITVMTYNVENLFDSLDDPGKQDETYLPIEKKKTQKHRNECAKLGRDWYRQQCMESDWSESKIQRKIGRLADVILQVKDGQGPDILIMQEVENLNILERLRQNGLAKAGYTEAILIEGPDERGIDVAMLSKLPQAAPAVLHPIKLYEVDRKTGKFDTKKEGRPTRGILQAQFKMPDGKTLTVLGVHFPSQGGPTILRREALKTLSEVRKKLPKNSYVIAAGDFNITRTEDAKEGLFAEVATDWLISHQVGCENCQGTHSYRGDWSFLDVMLFSKNFQDSPWKVDTESIRIPNQSLYQLNHWGAPARFDDGVSQKGVSDHWPMAVDILPQETR